MKKIMFMTFISVIMLFAFCGCGSDNSSCEEPTYEDEYTCEEDYGCEDDYIYDDCEDWEDTSPIPGLVEDALGDDYDSMTLEEYEAAVGGITDPEELRFLIEAVGEENVYQGADGAWYVDPNMYYRMAESYEAGSNQQEAIDKLQQMINEMTEIDPTTDCPDCGELLEDGYCGECERQWHKGADGTWQ